jgi:hypothetical protein
MKQFIIHGGGARHRVTWTGPDHGERVFATREEALAWVEDQRAAELLERQSRRTPYEDTAP